MYLWWGFDAHGPVGPESLDEALDASVAQPHRTARAADDGILSSPRSNIQTFQGQRGSLILSGDSVM